MFTNKQTQNYLINFILTVLMSFCFSYALTTTLNLKYPAYMLILAISAVTLFYSAITVNKIVLKISLLSMLVLVIGIVGFLFYKLGFSEIYVNIEYFCNWLYDYVSSFKVKLVPVYGIIIASFFVLVTTLFTFIFTIKRYNFIVILISGSLLFAVQFVNKYLMTINTFYLFLFLMVIYYMKHIFIKNSSRDTNEYISHSSFLIFIVPLCAVILFVTYMIPVRPKPLEWKWMDSKLKIFYNNYFKSGVPSKFDYFSLTETGFGTDSSNLGGKINKNKKLVLRVKSPRPIYLKGSIKDAYTGRSWLSTDHSTKMLADKSSNLPIDYNETLKYLSTDNINPYRFENNSLLINYLELLVGMRILTNDEDVIRRYFTRDKIDITFQNLSTKTLFLPENAYQLNVPNMDVMLGANGDLTTSEHMTKNFKYSLNSLNFVINKKTEDLLRKSNEDLFKEYYNYMDYVLNINSQMMEKSNNVLQAYSENTDTPTELVDIDGFKLIVFALGKNVLQSPNVTNQDKFSSVPQLDFSNAPQKVLDMVVQHSNNKGSVLLNSSIFNISESDNAYSYVVILNQELQKAPPENSYFNLQDFQLPINLFSRNTLELLRSNSNEAYSKYLLLPPDLPERIKNLAKSITDNKSNRYDKVKSIERYLSKNYKYTLTPDDTPTGRDFVDYFLFDLKKGYCTYYATSMVVMLRTLGIPARYVEGYIVTSGSKKGDEYQITNEKAHAWVEAYFEGFGWIKFEPTAAYASNDPQNNRNSSDDDSRTGSRPSWIENQNNSNPGNMQVNQLPDNVNKPLIILGAVILAIFLSLLALAALILINYIKGRRKLRILSQMDPRESIVSVYKQILHHMSILGYNKLDKETPKDFANRLGSSIAASRTNLNAVTDVFITARYSKNFVTDKDKAYVLDSFYNLTLYTRQSMGKFKHFVLKYLKGKI
ncbi:MAG TPA: transglutaminase domain-containing protein [Pseudobacteroides sp.]|uniref:transglutaminase domain-containing protein n=1 Tax=Pseudobacteroides sp. TaxID=1968840 RepID=UPI002F93D195